jgi:hypothetical protein
MQLPEIWCVCRENVCFFIDHIGWWSPNKNDWSKYQSFLILVNQFLVIDYHIVDESCYLIYMCVYIYNVAIHHLDPTDRQIDRVRCAPRRPLACDSTCIPPTLLGSARPHTPCPCGHEPPPARASPWLSHHPVRHTQPFYKLAEHWKMGDRISSDRKLLSSEKMSNMISGGRTLLCSGKKADIILNGEKCLNTFHYRNGK